MNEYEKQQQTLLRKTKLEIKHLLQARGIETTQAFCRDFAKRYGGMNFRDEIYRKRCEEVLATLNVEVFPLPIAQSAADATLQSQYLAVVIDAIVSHSYKSLYVTAVGPPVKLAVANTAGTAIELQAFVYSTLLQHLLSLRAQPKQRTSIAKTAIEMLNERIDDLERRINDLEAQLRQGGSDAATCECQTG